VEQAEVRALFDDNAETYDRVNTAVSLGLDARWRDWAARNAVTHAGVRVLDAFAGTGRVGVRAAELGAQVTLADLSPKMLQAARAFARARGVQVDTVTTDLASEQPAGLGAFDALTVMWGLRYLHDPAGTLKRLSALIVPGGRIVVVDFTEPDGGALTRGAAWYFFRILPRIAGTLAGRSQLYRELIATTHTMGSRQHLIELVGQAGLEVIEQRVMGFGLVVGVVAVVADSGSEPASSGDSRMDARRPQRRGVRGSPQSLHTSDR
jgi:demethylmenaquinone methyltransferase / 2-methoxy-6-polyprenyl-1,4-benzoquinol methylase